MTSSRVRLAAIAGLLLLIVAAHQALASSAWNTPAGTAIERTIQGAMIARQAPVLPPPRYRHGPVPAPVVQAMEKKVRRRLALYYTGSQLRAELHALLLSVAAEERYGLGGEYWKVGPIDPGNLSLSGRSADATARVTARSVPLSGSAPSAVNKTDHAFHLVRIKGRWLIASDRWSFVQGYEP